MFKGLRFHQQSTHQYEPDLVENIIGSFGKFHLLICFLIFLSKLPIAFHQMAIIFLSPKTIYFCPDTNGQTCPCTNPEYDTSIFNRTIVMEWQLICERAWLRDFTQTVFQLGALLGSVFFGMASDKYGRRYAIIVAVVLQIVAGVIATYIPNYWGFTLIRFLVGVSVGGTMVVGFVIVMEYVGSKHRPIISVVYQMFFNIGHILTAVFGYFFRDFTSFQLAISLPSVILLSYIYFVPETPRWLLAMKKTDKAIDVMQKVAQINNRPTETIKNEVESHQTKINEVTVKKGTIVDLFRTPNLRKRIIVMSFNWLVCSYCFYGVSQYVGQLSGDVFLNVAASASLTLLATLSFVPLIGLIGRKTIVIVFNITTAICLLSLSFVPEGLLSVLLAIIGVMASFLVFVTVYLYCSEMFPTVVRNVAIGVSSMMARVGSMVAPFVVGLHEVKQWLPPLVFGVMPVIATLLCFILPETRDCELMTTLEEGENFCTTPKKRENSNKST